MGIDSGSPKCQAWSTGADAVQRVEKRSTPATCDATFGELPQEMAAYVGRKGIETARYLETLLLEMVAVYWRAICVVWGASIHLVGMAHAT